MRLYKRGKTWWVGWGTERRSTKCQDRKAAELKAREFERERADPRLYAAQTTTLSDAIRATYDELRRRECADATITRAKHKLGHFPRLWGLHMPIARIDAGLVAAYVDARLAEGVKRITIRDELAFLRQLLKIANRLGTWAGKHEEVLPMRFESQHTPRDRWHTQQQALALLTALATRRAAHAAFIFATGARKGESFRARRCDVDLEAGEVFLRGTKTRKALRRVPITNITRELIRFALAHAPGEDVLFDGWDKLHRDVQSAAKRAGIEGGTSPNDWRRSYAKWHRVEGVPTSLIAPMLGHATDKLVQTTYAKLEGAELGKAIENVVPDLYRDNADSLEELRQLRTKKRMNEAGNCVPPAEFESATFALGKSEANHEERNKNNDVESAYSRHVRDLNRVRATWLIADAMLWASYDALWADELGVPTPSSATGTVGL